MRDAILFIESGLRGFDFAAAKNLGYDVILISQGSLIVDPNWLKSVDVQIKLPNVTYGQVLECLPSLQQRHRILACLSTSDYWAHLAAKLAQYLRLSGNKPEAILNCVDKLRSREVLRRGGFQQPNSRLCQTYEDVLNFVDEMCYPIVLKPQFGTMSSGVVIVRDSNDLSICFRRLQAHIKLTRGLTPGNAVIAEEFVPGDIFSLELIRSNQGDYILGFTDRVLVPGNEVVEMGFTFPVELENGSEITSTIQRALDVVGFGLGPCHVEIIRSKDRMVILEINPRVGGVPVLMVNEAYQINLVEEWIKLYTHSTWEFPDHSVRVVSCREIATPVAGRLVGVKNWDNLNDEHAVVYKELYYERLNGLVQVPKSNIEIFGRIMTQGNTTEEARKRSQDAIRALRLVVETTPYGIN